MRCSIKYNKTRTPLIRTHIQFDKYGIEHTQTRSLSLRSLPLTSSIHFSPFLCGGTSTYPLNTLNSNIDSASAGTELRISSASRATRRTISDSVTNTRAMPGGSAAAIAEADIRTYSKSSNTEREKDLLKIQQERERDDVLKIRQHREREGRTQNPATEV